MHAVIRETVYSQDFKLENSSQFKEFQAVHARQPGYKGTVVTEAGEGRYITVTLWEARENMDAARQALTPVVERLLNPILTAPSQLFGAGTVVYSDISANNR